MTLDALRQSWPGVVDAIKAKGRVAAIVIGNASVASFDEGVLTLRFPRQGDVKGFQGSKYEELLKQALAAMFGVNVMIRAVTGGGDAPSPARRPGPGPAAPPGANGQAPPAGHGPARFARTPGTPGRAAGGAAVAAGLPAGRRRGAAARRAVRAATRPGMGRPAGGSGG